MFYFHSPELNKYFPSCAYIISKKLNNLESLVTETVIFNSKIYQRTCCKNALTKDSLQWEMTQFSSTTKCYFSFHKKAFRYYLEEKKFLQKNSTEIFDKTFLLTIMHRLTSKHMHTKRLFFDNMGEITIIILLQKTRSC